MLVKRKFSERACGILTGVVGVASLLAFSVGAVANDWHRTLDAPDPAGWIPQHATVVADGGYILAGDLVGLGEVHQRFDAQGMPVGPVMAGPWPSLVARSDPAGPRPVVVLDEWMTDLLPGLDPSPCRRSLQANGVETRVIDAAMRQGHVLGSLDAGDGSFAVNAFGQGSRFHRYGPDCSVQVIGQYDFFTFSIANSSSAIFAYALTSAEGANDGVETLRGVTREGLAWSRQFPVDGAPLQGLRLLQEIDGEIVIGGARGGTGRILRIGPDGEVRWQRDLPSTNSVIWSKATVAGLLLATASADSTPANRLRFSLLDPADGSLAWESLSDMRAPASLTDIPSASASLALLAVYDTTSGMLRIDPDGALTHYAAIDPPYGAIIELPDGRLLAWTFQLEMDPDLQVPAAIRRELFALDFAALDSPEQLDPLPLALPALATVSAQDADRIYAAETLGERLRITAIGMDGEPAWTNPLSERAFLGHSGRPLQPAMVTGADSVCLQTRRDRRYSSGGFPEGLDERGISCLDASSGNVLAVQINPMPTVASGERRDVSLRRVLARDGSTVSVLVYNRVVQCPGGQTCVSTYERLDLNVDGVLDRVVLAEGVAPGIRSSPLAAVEGPAVLFDHIDLTSGQRELRRVALDGSHETLAQLPEGWRSLAEAFYALPLEDDSILYFSPQADTGALRLLRLSAQGATLWNSEIALDPALVDPFEWQVLEVAGDPGLGLSLLLGVEGSAGLHRLTPEGGLDWQRPAIINAGDALLAMHADSERIQLSSRRADQLLVRSYAPGDGREMGFLREGIGSGLAGLGWTTEGDLVLASFGRSIAGLPLEGGSIRRLSAPEAEAPEFAAGSLAGAWYDPASTGQGLYLHYLANNASAVGTWFTFDSEGGTDRADLRWYTLVGPAAAGANEAQLAIRVNESGRFDAPPATTSSEVGQATLRLLSCGTLAIDYAFDADNHGGAQGTLYLQRLTPSTACAGSNAPAASSPPGFWFEPATSGQGLALLPLAGSDGNPGGMAGAWFTFDPEDLADDEGAQHWFTLLGGAPQDGRYRMQILRTIGSALDAAPTRNTLRVGEAELRVVDCSTAVLDYQFDDADPAAEFAALAGSIPLQRIEPCPQ